MARKKVSRNIAYDEVKKSFYVTFNYGMDANGKRAKNTKTYKTEKEAKQALKKFEADKANGNVVKPKTDTVETYINYWLDNIKARNCQETTLYGYRTICQHIIPQLGLIPIQKLTPKELNQYFTFLKNEKGLSNNTIRKHFDLLQDCLDNAVTEDLILRNPIKKVEKPRKTESDKNIYNEEQLIKLYEVVSGTKIELAVKLAGYLGYRREEIVGLKWDKVDMHNQSITISEVRTQAGSKVIQKQPKTKNSRRTLAFSNLNCDLLEVLNNQKKRLEELRGLFGETYNKDGYVLINEETGIPYTPNSISRIFNSIIKKHNLPELTLHGLRHTFASLGNKAGVSLYDMSKILGHGSPSVTADIYTHLYDQTHANALEKIAGQIHQETNE